MSLLINMQRWSGSLKLVLFYIIRSTQGTSERYKTITSSGSQNSHMHQLYYLTLSRETFCQTVRKVFRLFNIPSGFVRLVSAKTELCGNFWWMPLSVFNVFVYMRVGCALCQTTGSSASGKPSGCGRSHVTHITGVWPRSVTRLRTLQ